MRKVIRYKKGLTLVELMLVSGIMVVVIVGILQVFIYSLNAISEARALNIAVDDLEDVLEQINNAPFSKITTVFGPVPEVIGPGTLGEDGRDQVAAAGIGGFLLDNEQIVVSFPQILSSPPVSLTDIPDPLEVEVSIGWTVKGRSHNKIYKTIRTRML